MARIFNEKSLGGLKLEEKQRLCPDCGSEDIVFDKGELYCKKCGLVLD
jgi:ribosomal protein S27AE